MKSFRNYKHCCRALVVAALLALPLSAAALDHDTDGKADLTVFRSNLPPFDPGTWLVSSSVYDGTIAYQWGLPGDYPVQGFYTGIKTNRGADLAVWRPSNGVWYLRHHDSVNYEMNDASAYQWGLGGDTPVPCDFDGDGRDDLAIWRSSTGAWFVRNSDGESEAFDRSTYQQWGLAGDTPIPADYDMDGTCDYTVYREGIWYVILSTENGEKAASIHWGAAGDIPVPGQYDTDTILDFAVYRENSTQGPLWVIRRSTLAGLTSRVIQWGQVGDLPVPADYTGDGKTDITVFRPSTGVWYMLTSESSYATSASFQFGLEGDIPVGDRRGSDPS